MNSLRPFIVTIGMGLILGGCAFLVYIAALIYQIFEDPGQAKLLAGIITYIKGDDKAITGSLNGQPIEIIFSENFQMMSYSVISAIVLSILAGIVIAIVNAGVQMVRVAGMSEEQRKREKAAMVGKYYEQNQRPPPLDQDRV